MSVIGSNVLAGASGGAGGGYEIERSLRFNSGDSAYLNRTPSATGNRKTWTWSNWIKKSKVGSEQFLLRSDVGGGNARDAIRFEGTDKLRVFFNGTNGGDLITNQVFRDPSAWYHLVVAVDTTQSTSANRVKIYVNGIQVTSFSTSTYPAQNYATGTFVSGKASTIGTDSNSNYLNSYLADVHFIDGQALAPTDFGETNTNNLWVPKAYAGTYGPLVDQSQTWSNGWSLTSGSWISGPNLAFDGVIGASTTQNRIDGDATWTAPSSVAFSSLRIWGFKAGANSVYVNGTDVSSQVVDGTVSTEQWNTITGISSPLSTIRITGNTSNTSGIGGVEIDGILLVDSGVSIGNNSFHLDFADNSSNAALGTDTSGNSNTWTVNNLQANSGITYAGTSTTAVNGEIPNGGTPYWVDILPTNASLDYSGNSFVNVHDGSGSTFVYLVGDEHSTGNVVRARFDLRDFSSVTSVRLEMLQFSGSTYVDYQAQLLDASKSAISGTLVDLDLTAQGWKTIPVSGSPKFIEISCTSGGDRRLKLYAVEVNGSSLVNSTLSASGIDSLVDTPTNGDTASDTGAGGEITGCYATLNPIGSEYNSSSVKFENGNLEITTNSYNNAATSLVSTIAISSGKFYFETQLEDTSATGAGQHQTGIVGARYIEIGGVSRKEKAFGQYADGWAWESSTGKVYNNDSEIADGPHWRQNVAGCAFDADTGVLKFYNNGTLDHTITGIPSGTYYFAVGLGKGATATSNSGHLVNFGQRAFAYPLSGYKALCTANLPEPTIADGSTAFDVALWSGTGSNQTISLGFDPDLIWSKTRTHAVDHKLVDSVRGFTKQVEPNQTIAEYTNSTGVTGTSSSGFTIGSSNDWNNSSSRTYVGWAWDAGSSNTTIAAGGLNSSLYDQSQTWSSNTTGVFNNNFEARAFDNQLDTTNRARPTNGTTAGFTFSGLGTVTSLRIWVHQGGTGGTVFTINGSDVTATVDAATNSGFVNFGSTFSTLTAITFNAVNSTNWYSIAGVEVNGKLLVDSGVSIPSIPTIASTVRANPSAGFSIVSYSGVDTPSTNTVGHGLNVAPSVYIIKNRTTASFLGWVFNTTVIDGSVDYLVLNSTAAKTDQGSPWSTLPTSSVFTLGANDGNTCDAGDDYIAYCFAPVEGYSSMGSYQGNGNADGPFVYTGMKPAWVMVKRTSATNDWAIWDNTRNTFNETSQSLFANLTAVEDSGFYDIDILSNGFKLRHTGTKGNGNGSTYIYIAFASNPFASNGGLAR
ncbi:hypothetical protein [uncultured Mediterranean phage uvDeep-CGR2-KM19-C184]|nr:hypothetical protein [uncultured Mediterranean phage uvDeep-CGR2-KM19-C184]